MLIMTPTTRKSRWVIAVLLALMLAWSMAASAWADESMEVLGDGIGGDDPPPILPSPRSWHRGPLIVRLKCVPPEGYDLMWAAMEGAADGHSSSSPLVMLLTREGAGQRVLGTCAYRSSRTGERIMRHVSVDHINIDSTHPR